MRKFNLVTAGALVVLLLMSCNKEEIDRSSDKTSSDSDKNLLRDSNYETYEDSLNIFHVSSVDFVVTPEIQAVYFEHSAGFIDATEWARIKDTISDMVSSGSPQFIDIDVEQDSIYIFTEESSSISSFPDDIHPDGGFRAGAGYFSGTWCDNSTDTGGGGLGRTMKGFWSGKSPLGSTDRFSDIRNLYIYGNCSDITNSPGSGTIIVYDNDIWHDMSACVSHSSCLDGTDLEDYVGALESIEANELPSGYKIIGCQVANKITTGDVRWSILVKFATEVAD